MSWNESITVLLYTSHLIAFEKLSEDIEKQLNTPDFRLFVKHVIVWIWQCCVRFSLVASVAVWCRYNRNAPVVAVAETRIALDIDILSVESSTTNSSIFIKDRHRTSVKLTYSTLVQRSFQMVIQTSSLVYTRPFIPSMITSLRHTRRCYSKTQFSCVTREIIDENVMLVVRMLWVAFLAVCVWLVCVAEAMRHLLCTRMQTQVTGGVTVGHCRKRKKEQYDDGEMFEMD